LFLHLLTISQVKNGLTPLLSMLRDYHRHYLSRLSETL
jgi:hypothetical protein